MQFTQIAALALGVVTFIGASEVADIVNPRPVAFLNVHSMEVKNGRVHIDRSYPRDRATVADWTVVVVPVGKDSPTCHTVRGPELHQGWSIYDGSERGVRDFSMNVWANDPSCESELIAGPYRMFTTWTPRDGSPPVVEMTEFYWEGTE